MTGAFVACIGMCMAQTSAMVAVEDVVTDTIVPDTVVAVPVVEMEIAEIEISDSIGVEPADSAAASIYLPVDIKLKDANSIYCHPYSMTYNNPDWKRLWTNTSVLGGAFVGTLLVLECLPEDATSWNRAELQDVPLYKRWYDHVIRNGPEWDHDNPVFNFVLHPYAGAAYFMAARSCGFNFWRSLLYSACVSTIGWEFGIEAFMERPSIQDIFITPLVGSAMGELMYKAKRAIVARDYELLGSKVIGNIAVFLCDPLNEFIDIFRHRNTHCAGTMVVKENGDIAYEAAPAPRVSGSLSPYMAGGYSGFSLNVTF